MTTLPGRTNTALIVIDVQNGVMDGAHNRDRDRERRRAGRQGPRAGRAGDLGPAHDDGPYRRQRQLGIGARLARHDSEPLVHKSYGDSFEATDLEARWPGGTGRLSSPARRPTRASARPFTARSPGATTSRWSATRTRRGDRVEPPRRTR